LSRVDKGKPQSSFKKIYSAAKQGKNAWAGVFLPWSARPDRDAAWFEEQRRDSLSRTGALDNLHEQYPSTDAEALAPRSLDKRIPPAWLAKCYHELTPLADPPLLLPGLRAYCLPEECRKYVIGADPAEGNPTSDDSAAVLLDVDSGAEVATLAGKFEPSVFAGYIASLSGKFGDAPVLCERNNHGHTVLLALRGRVRCLLGRDGKAGWLTNAVSKSHMFDILADIVREENCSIHDLTTFQQLASVEGSTLRAPSGQHDDYAMAFALATVARGKTPSTAVSRAEFVQQPQRASMFGQQKSDDWERRPDEQKKSGLWTRQPTRLFG
jgi:hypothetical protein